MNQVVAATVWLVCGRFVSASPPDELAKYFSAEVPEQALEENYNVAPTTPIYSVRARDGNRSLATLRWGLVPFWAKDTKIGSKMINARSETAPEKPAFRRAFRKRRCLIPADGFYEWAKVAGSKAKQPYFIHRVDEESLVFAGLWERWVPKDEEGKDLADTDPVDTCTILTCAANETMAPVHDRMPVMIPPGSWDEWLDPDSDPDNLRELLVPASDSLLTLYPVSTGVNSVRNNGAQLLERVKRESPDGVLFDPADLGGDPT